MKRRVVVTGIGAVSPNGVGREVFWKATRNGVSGVRNITRFDASDYAVQVAGEVVDFDESRYVSAKDRQHVSRAVPLGIAAVEEALIDAGLETTAMTRDQLRGIGVIVGSGGGSQEFTEEQYRLYYTGHIKQCSVYTIPTSTIGTLASEISMRFGFRGLSHIVSTGCTSSTDAIGYSFRNIQAGVLDVMVSGGVDAPIAPLIIRGFMLMRIMTSSWNAEPEAGIPPEAVEYINYHGTSTELNDRIETRATKLAFNGHAYKLAGSSLKSLIGHPQGACGAASIASTLLAMRDSVAPPTINIDEPDPECDLDYVPKTARKLDFEYAVSNCIAFGSKNSAMVLRKIHAA